MIAEEFINLEPKNFKISMACSQQDILTTNGTYSITWHAGSSLTSGLFNPNDYTVYAKLGSYVNTPFGPVLYLSWFFTSPNAIAVYWSGVSTYLNFPISVGSLVSNEYDTNSSTCVLKGDIPNSTFVTILNGQYVTIIGSTTF